MIGTEKSFSRGNKKSINPENSASDNEVGIGGKTFQLFNYSTILSFSCVSFESLNPVLMLGRIAVRPCPFLGRIAMRLYGIGLKPNPIYALGTSLMNPFQNPLAEARGDLCIGLRITKNPLHLPKTTTFYIYV
jgi:hypothetical protein